MKVHIEIDCTPAEARAFFGLPDIAPLQEELLKEARDRMRANMAKMDVEALFKTWFPAGLQGLEQMQKTFWQQFSKEGGKKGPGE